MSIRTQAYYFDQPGTPLARRDTEIAAPDHGEAIVEVIACGLCHTDLSFYSGAVPTRHPRPLVLGHEVVGKVALAGDGARGLVGKPVLIPAVLPCGDCVYCKAGRSNACDRQRMLGNDVDGGFATHVKVPSRWLIPVDDAPKGFPIDELAVVADATSTGYQAVRRSGLVEGDVAMVVGTGGVGGFVAQIAGALGARVIACDVSQSRLDAAVTHAKAHPVNVTDRAPRDVKKEVHALARAWGIPSLRWRIFECSGTTAGQELAFELLARAATLVVVGYTPDSIKVRLSNLMAHDATVQGTWGCPPEVYPQVLGLIYAGKVAIGPMVEKAPMSSVNALLDAMKAHQLVRRPILDPRA